MRLNVVLKKLMSISVFLLTFILMFGNLNYANATEFTFRGRIEVDSTNEYHRDCTVWGNPLLHNPYTVTFDIPSYKEPDSFVPFRSATYIVDGSHVQFVVGGKVYPLSQLIFTIGRDMVTLYFHELDKLIMEYYWPVGTFYGYNHTILCQVAEAPVSVVSDWVDNKCYGVLDAVSMGILCTLDTEDFPVKTISDFPIKTVADYPIINPKPKTELSPYKLNSMAKVNIEDFLGTDDEWLEDHVTKSADQITKTLKPELWVDEFTLATNGKEVFESSKKAVHELKYIFQKDGLAQEIKDAALMSTEYLVNADSILAKRHIDKAENLSMGLDDSKIDEYIKKAKHEFAEATMQVNTNDFESSVGHFKKAWEYAEKALDKISEGYLNF